jgi:hypothetical protein
MSCVIKLNLAEKTITSWQILGWNDITIVKRKPKKRPEQLCAIIETSVPAFKSLHKFQNQTPKFYIKKHIEQQVVNEKHEGVFQCYDW